jgi:hypothetical protein
MNFKLHNDFSDFDAPVWNVLVEQSIADTPFSRYEYLAEWWQTRGGGEWKNAQLVLISASENDQLIGHTARAGLEHALAEYQPKVRRLAEEGMAHGTAAALVRAWLVGRDFIVVLDDVTAWFCRRLLRQAGRRRGQTDESRSEPTGEPTHHGTSREKQPYDTGLGLEV